MKNFLLSTLSILFYFTTTAQEVEFMDADLINTLYDYEQVEIDSILSIQLPFDFFESTESEDGIESHYWFGYGENDEVFMVHRARIDERICLSNRREMKSYYDNTLNDWTKDEEIKVVKDERVVENDVYQAYYIYNELDEDGEEMLQSSYRLIQIKETLYQIGVTQPLKTKDRSVDEDFFNSIVIQTDFALKNQYTACGTFDLIFGDEDDDSSTTAYEIGEILGGFACVAVFLLLFGLVIFFMVRTNRKNKQKEWDQFNS